MTMGEEGITSDLTVELWGSGGAAVEVGCAGAGEASAGASDGMLSSRTWAEGSDPF